jgi:hypothetical protein
MSWRLRREKEYWNYEFREPDLVLSDWKSPLLVTLALDPERVGLRV